MNLKREGGEWTQHSSPNQASLFLFQTELVSRRYGDDYWLLITTDYWLPMIGDRSLVHHSSPEHEDGVTSDLLPLHDYTPLGPVL